MYDQHNVSDVDALHLTRLGSILGAHVIHSIIYEPYCTEKCLQVRDRITKLLNLAMLSSTTLLDAGFKLISCPCDYATISILVIY